MVDIFNHSSRSAEEPFLDDYLKMEKSVKKAIDEFLEFDTNLGKGSVMGLSSPFGTGKSTFIEMARYYMEFKNNQDNQDNKYISAYINVSENEFHQNPLLIILKVICRAIDEDYRKTKKDKDHIKIIIIKLIKLALKMTTPFDTKLYLEESERVNDRLYERFTQPDDLAKQKFILYLEEMVKNKKLIVFLDDIDRCSPNFAVKILEQLKFYFESLNITFVVSYDRSQLEDFLRLRFGKNIDIEGYLQKFFDYNYMFGPMDKDEFINKTKDKCVERLKLNTSSIKALKYFIKSIKCDEYKKHIKHYALRDLQQIIFRIAFGMNYKEEKDDYIYDSKNKLLNALIILVFVRRINRKLYTYFYNGNIDGIEFCYRMYKDEKLKTLFDKDFYIPILFYNRDFKQDIDMLVGSLEKLKDKEFISEKDASMEKNDRINNEQDKQDFMNDKLEVPLRDKDNIASELYNHVKSAFDILEYD